jgi:hypothetical protein
MRIVVTAYWVGTTLHPAGELLAPDDPQLVTVHTKAVTVQTIAV